MSNNPVTDAFFFGRAFAEVMSEKLEESFTSAMSDLGRFDAEQRENLRQFIEEVQVRAAREEGATTTTTTTTTTYTAAPRPRSTNDNGATSTPNPVIIDTSSTNSDELQAMLDRLRAEIATLRSELKKYRN